MTRLRLLLSCLALGLPALAADTIEPVGGHVYRTRIDAGGASIALWRYAASGGKSGPPILLVPELFCEQIWYDPFAKALQQRGREVFLFEWRGTGQSGRPAEGFGDLASLFLGDAPAAFDAALAAGQSKTIELIGHGLGGEAAVLLASSARGEHISSLVLVSVPATYSVPNEALRRFIQAARARPRSQEVIEVGPFSSQLVPLGDSDRPGQWAEAQPQLDLFSLVLAHGTQLSAARIGELRQRMGAGTPGLFAELAAWMETGDLNLREGTRAPAQKLSQAWEVLAQPALLVVAPLDNLVHPEHALARRGEKHVVRDEMLLQRLEGFPEDAGHLALQTSWASGVLAPRMLDWLREHP